MKHSGENHNNDCKASCVGLISVFGRKTKAEEEDDDDDDEEEENDDGNDEEDRYVFSKKKKILNVKNWKTLSWSLTKQT